MDFSYLQAAAADLQPKTANQPDMANVTIRVDADAFMLCDGEYMEDIQLKAGIIKKMQLPIGQHLLEFISSDNPDMKVEKQVDFPLPGRNYLVLVNELKALIDAPAQLEQQRQAEEAARKKAEDAEEERVNKMTPQQKFEEGKSIYKQDYNRGIRLIMDASKEGLAEATKFLAFGWADGEYGMKKAEVMGYCSWLRFLEQADKDDKDLGKVNYKLGYTYQYGAYSAYEDYEKSVEYYEQAAKLGYVEALKKLAFGYNFGQGCFPKDGEIALKYYLEFAAKGNETYDDYNIALNNLGVIYQYGKYGASEDYEKSVKYYERAAKLGNFQSLSNLAFGYDFGKGCFPKDGEKALKYYLEFAAKGDETYDEYKIALYNLGQIYFYGLNGAEKDKEKAISYYKRSADLGYQDAKDKLREIESE